MNPRLEHPTQKTVIEIIQDLTQDWGFDDDVVIDGHTLLVEQIDFSSVDIIQLCVALEQHYGRKLDFQALLMADGSYVGDLSIRQVADFVAKKLSQR